MLGKNSSRTDVVKKNILGSLIIKGISIAISFMIVPMTLGYVSTDVYGVWLTLSSISVWLGFFDIGFTLGLKNKLTEALAIKDYDKAKRLISTTYVLLFLIFFPLCFILQFVIPIIDWCELLNVKSEYADDIIRTMRVIVVCFSLQMILNIINTIFQSLQRVALSSLFPVIGNACSLILIFFSTIYIKPSLLVLSFCISVTPIAVYVISSIILYVGKLKHISPSLRYVDFSLFHDLFELGAKFFIIQIQVVVFYQTTNFLISNISTPVDVSIYNIASKYLGTATMIFVLIMNPFWPAFADAKTKSDYNWMKAIYIKLTKLYLLFSVGVMCMVLVSPIVYNVWIGEELEIPVVWTAIISIYTLVNCWDSLHVYILNGLSVLKLQTYIVLIGLIFHIPLSYFLGQYFSSMGVLISMIFITLIYSVVFTIQVRKLLVGTAYGVWAK